MKRAMLMLAMAATLNACQEEAQPEAAAQNRSQDKPGGEFRTTGERIVGLPDGGAVKVVTVQAPPAAAEEKAALASKCSTGDQEACTAIGRLNLNAGDTALAEKAWRKACDEGHAPACFALGNMLSNPYLKLGREPEAVAPLEKACDTGFGAACYFLGRFHERGACGLPVDTEAARRYFEKGCQGGHYWACEKVGRKPPPGPIKP